MEPGDYPVGVQEETQATGMAAMMGVAAMEMHRS